MLPPDADVVLFLGAGVSAPMPSGAPLFAEVRDACAERVGVATASWRPDDPRRALLNHVIPEVFLKVLTDAGYGLEDALIQAVSGMPGSGPNAVHRLAARVLTSGGTVWTTNWDIWIERAYEDLTGQPLLAATNGVDPPPSRVPRYGKLHGTIADPSSLMFRTPQIIRPLNSAWHDALVSSCRDKRLFVAGYAGADVDLFPALREALRVARDAYWLEGVGDADFRTHAQAQYEIWRFQLDGRHDDPTALPGGRRLVWCGAGSTASDPSHGLLDALGDGSTVGPPAPWQTRYDAVRKHILPLRPDQATLGRRLVVSAVVRERLADRAGAAVRYTAALVVGSNRERIKALAALRNLVLLRAQPLRLVASRVYARVARDERADFIRQHAGGISHNQARAERLADGTESTTIDDALNVAMSTRWAGNLRTAERLARAQLKSALAQDLASPERDWPERVSRAAFELAQALVWQGRYADADDVCRSGYMRVSGAKWTGWEFAMRATVRFAFGDYETAEAHFAEGETLLRLEGFADFTITLSTGRAASYRALARIFHGHDHLDGPRGSGPAWA